jgi:MmyB-like transcription regulator ligand binding domain
MLREWRCRRRLSQLELALEAAVSSRHLSFVETGLLPQWRAQLLERLRRDAFAKGDPAFNALYDELASYPSGDAEQPLDAGYSDVAVPLRLRDGSSELSFISTRTTFGNALDVTAVELAIESFFPTDERTADALRAAAEADKRKT